MIKVLTTDNCHDFPMIFPCLHKIGVSPRFWCLKCVWINILHAETTQKNLHHESQPSNFCGSYLILNHSHPPQNLPLVPWPLGPNEAPMAGALARQWSSALFQVPSGQVSLVIGTSSMGEKPSGSSAGCWDPEASKDFFLKWVCLKMGYTPNEIAIY